MKERPILFSTPMVEAILDGRKTQTRRLYKNAPPSVDLHAIAKHSKDYIYSQCPYGKPGDLLWVRESFSPIYRNNELFSCLYKASNHLPPDRKWKPSIHMPKAAARIWLRVKDVRVERLHDITNADAIAEGIEIVQSEVFMRVFKNYNSPQDEEPYFIDPKFSFMSLWCKINGEVSWLQNPWVWVVEYDVMSTSGKPGIKVCHD
jgi:hypothetical protein